MQNEETKYKEAKEHWENEIHYARSTLILTLKGLQIITAIYITTIIITLFIPSTWYMWAPMLILSTIYIIRTEHLIKKKEKEYKKVKENENKI